MNFRPAAVLAVLSIASLASAETYTIDPIHSCVIFKVKHAESTNFYGMFEKTEGTLTTEGDALKSVTVKIDADSLHTHNKDRDEHLRGPDFFDVKQYPDITFTSKSVKAVDGGYEVTGDLTLHGTTKEQTIKLTKTGTGQFMGKDIVSYETSFTISRSDFGVSGYIGKGIGDEVTLIVSVECDKQ